MRNADPFRSLAVALTGLALVSCWATASSHREAPLITATPKLDAADFYVFNSYEPGRSNYVTLIANYLPLQDAYGGPNYFSLDPEALYEIHIDNTGDAQEHLTFQFRFANTPRDIALTVGPPGNQRTNAVPVLAVGQIGVSNVASLNLDQTYTLTLVTGNRRTGAATPIANAANGSTTFTRPMDNIGNKTIPDYAAYARSYIYEIHVPGSSRLGRVFVGQRKDPFVVNLGETFDLINISSSPLGPEDANRDSLWDKNVTSLVLELPTEALTTPGHPVLGAWTTASKITTSNGTPQITQISRLGMPLVNEVVIGLKDKDKFNASQPKDDLVNFVDYITHPTLPAIIELLYGSAGAKAPTAFPRNDLVATFATGIDGLNKNGGVGEMVRLNTSIMPTPRAQQDHLGVIAGISKGVLDASKADLAGFPNGRRPGDDVVDIALRVVMGKLLAPSVAPAGDVPFTDGAHVDARMFAETFPYLNPPLAGSPNEPYVIVTLQAAPAVDGPYQPTPAAYDPRTRSLSMDQPAGRSEFLRLKGDRKTEIQSINRQNGKLNLGVK